LHYGLFCFVHGIFVFAMFTMNDAFHAGVEPTTESFDLVGRVVAMLQADSDLMWSTVALCIVQVGAFGIFWLGGQRWRETDAIRQMFEPYGRIVVMHLTIFIATIPVLIIGQPMLAVLVLALLKSGLDLGLAPFQVATPEFPSAQK
jgi:putative copper export protein